MGEVVVVLVSGCKRDIVLTSRTSLQSQTGLPVWIRYYNSAMSNQNSMLALGWKRGKEKGW